MPVTALPGPEWPLAFAAPTGRSAGPPPNPVPVALGPAIARALRGPPGRIVLRVEEAALHRRRVARALLQEGALAAGGQVLDGPGGDLLLVGAEAGRATRLRTLVERLVGPAGTLVWSLDRDVAALLDYAAGNGVVAPSAGPGGPTLAELDATLDALPLSRALRRVPGVEVRPGAPPQPAFLRLEPARAQIAVALGVLGGDADLLDHAARRLAARLFAALANPAEARALLGPGRLGRLHLPLPAGLPASGVAPPGRLVATVPLVELADPAAFASRQAGLAAAGIAVELDGLDAGALDLLDAEALPPVMLRVHWSPALAGPGPRAALRRLDPARLVLAGGDEAAIHFAAALGIGLVEMPA